MNKIKDIAQYEISDSELAKYTILALQTRINKAIEYIEKTPNRELSVDSYYKFKDLYEFNELLNILKGKENG